MLNFIHDKIEDKFTERKTKKNCWQQQSNVSTIIFVLYEALQHDIFARESDNDNSKL